MAFHFASHTDIKKITFFAAMCKNGNQEEKLLLKTIARLKTVFQFGAFSFFFLQHFQNTETSSSANCIIFHLSLFFFYSKDTMKRKTFLKLATQKTSGSSEGSVLLLLIYFFYFIHNFNVKKKSAPEHKSGNVPK